MRPFGAKLLVRQSPEQAYAFLAELQNHWHLDDRLLRLERLDDDRDGGAIVIQGPLGLRRTARIRLTQLTAPRLVVGEAAVGPRTRALVTWTITPRGGGALVAVEAAVLSAGSFDRLLLAIGGRRWMRRRFDDVLVTLAGALDDARAGRASAPQRPAQLSRPRAPA